MVDSTYTGTIKSFNPFKGWGFVECAELAGDAFIQKSELGGFAVTKGDQVSFTVIEGSKGLQATNVSVLSTRPDGSRSFYGEVKTWNSAKGFGFLSSPALTKVFGKDAFALRGEFQDGLAMQGLQVLFQAREGERGPVASDVRVVGQGNMASAVAAQWGQFAGAWGGKGAMVPVPWAPQASNWPMATQGWGVAGPGNWKSPLDNAVYFGTLKGINAEKGWGHISSEPMTKLYGKDIFVMKTSIDAAGVTIGQLVSFNVAQGPKGPHATNLKPLQEQSSGMVFTGVLKYFNDAKGYGFVESPEALSIFHAEIFLHRAELNGQVVNVGSQVQFNVDISSGRASAKDVKVVE